MRVETEERDPLNTRKWTRVKENPEISASKNEGERPAEHEEIGKIIGKPRNECE